MLRMLVRYGTQVRFTNGLESKTRKDPARIMNGDGEYTNERAIVQNVESLLHHPGTGQLMARTTGGEVWPCGHADHRDYELIALMG